MYNDRPCLPDLSSYVNSSNAKISVVEVRNFSFPPEVSDSFEDWPYYGICGKCSNYVERLNRDCLCYTCLSYGVKRIGPLNGKILQFVKPRF